MRSIRLPFLTAIFALLSGSAMAQSVTSNTTWSQLDPGDDWAAKVIQSIFPISETATGSGTVQTVVGHMMSDLTYCVAAVAMVFVIYSLVMKMHRTAETASFMSQNFTTMSVVRMGFAVILMMPALPSGFSIGQALVVRTALWGVGIAKMVYQDAVNDIMPGNTYISMPIIPDTTPTVLGLIKSELCRSLVNTAAHAELIPEPQAIQIGAAGGSPMTVISYDMAGGAAGSSATCGSILIPAPKQGATNILGYAFDQSGAQASALTATQSAISGTVGTMVAQAYGNHNAADFAGLQDVLSSNTSSYTLALTTIVSNMITALQTPLSYAGSSDSANQAVINAVGWSGAGAYYLQFAELNGALLSSVSNVPEITPPSFEGLSQSLMSDIAPYEQSANATLMMMANYADPDTSSATTMPASLLAGGLSGMYGGSAMGDSGAGAVDSFTRDIGLNDYFLQQLQQGFTNPDATPGGNNDVENWIDPFGSLLRLGDTLITFSVNAMGNAALLGANKGSAGNSIFGQLTSQLAGQMAPQSGGGNGAMNFLSMPIFLTIISLITPGMLLTTVLPMVPWVMWMAGVMGWLILVCEAVVAVPLWMLAHMTLEGSGLHGNARHGYSLLFSVLFRPVLMVIGLFLSYFVFSAMSWLIRQTIGIAAGFVLENGGTVTNLLSMIMLLHIFVMTLFTAAVSSFRMISILPDNIPRIVGFYGQGRTTMDEFARDGVIGPGHQAIAPLQQTGSMEAQSLLQANVGSSQRGGMMSLPSSNVSPTGRMDTTTSAMSETTTHQQMPATQEET